MLSFSPLLVAAPLLVVMVVVALVSGQNPIWVNVIAWVGGGLILALSFARIVVRIRHRGERRHE
jgi:hypothetical protein